MKIIIGVYDRELSHNLAIILSSKKFFPIEAESFEEIPALLQRHKDAMLLTEDINVEFYQKIQVHSPKTKIFFLFHLSFSTTELLKLQNFGIQAVFPYSEDATKIVEMIIHNLSVDKETIKSIQYQQNDTVTPNNHHKNIDDVAIHMSNTKRWIYATLEGFNSSKIAIRVTDQLSQMELIEEIEDNFLMYLQNMNIRLYVDFVYHKENIFIFRYRKMSQMDAERLAFYIHYCQKQNIAQNELMK
ncbi:MAG: hypothetical protein ACRCVW_02895 [Brevinema sp.]